MIKTCALAAMLAIGGAAGTAQAQLFSEPYQFHRSGGFDGGPGMSVGYREAIIDEELTGNQPEFFLRDSFGNLLDVQEGPNGLAVVRSRGSTIFPGATAGRGGISLGLAIRIGSSSGGYGYIPDPAAAITSWTSMAAGLTPPPQRWILRGHQPAPIDAWVAQAAVLPPFPETAAQ
jgi:hypothetical protein